MLKRVHWLLLPGLLLVVVLALGLRRHVMARLAAGGTISVLVEVLSEDASADSGNAKQAIAEVLESFRRYNPDAEVRWSMVHTSEFDQRLDFLQRRGLAPDLMLVLNTDLLDLRARGQIEPVELTVQERANIRPALVNALEMDGLGLGIPYVVFTGLACFDRQHLPEAPQSLDALIDLAKQETTIGLPSSFSELWWIYTGFNPQDSDAIELPTPENLKRFLRWLRLANLQPAIAFEADAEQLRRGLSSGRYQWIACNNRWLPSLQSQLGPRLGRGVLPSGPAGPPQPLVQMRIWTFGRQSSHRQRELARRLATFSTNLVQQRTLALKLGSVIPVNPGIALPLKAYPLIALQEQQYRRGTLLNLQQFAALERLNLPAQPLLNAVISGNQSPEVIAPLLMAVLEQEVKP